MTTATKGIPANKIEVRPQDQQPNYSGPTTAFNPMLVGLSNEAQLILATSLGTTGNVKFISTLRRPQKFEKNLPTFLNFLWPSQNIWTLCRYEYILALLMKTVISHIIGYLEGLEKVKMRKKPLATVAVDTGQKI